MAQWKQETILKLINSYYTRRFLWDNTCQEYTDRNKRIEAWKNVANEVGCDVMTVERKLKSLKTHFMAVHKAYTKRRQKAGSNSSTAIKPKWFAYDALSFLAKGRSSRNKSEAVEKQTTNHQPVFSWRPQESTTTRDEFTVFAEHVAIRLKNVTDPCARLIAQHRINNTLFEAEMGKYNNAQYYHEMVDEPSIPNDTKSKLRRIPVEIYLQENVLRWSNNRILFHKNILDF